MPRPTGTPKSEPRVDVINVMMLEYQSLRAEIVAAIGHRVAVMNFTFAAMAVLIGGLLTRKVPDTIAAVIAIFGVPQFARAGLLIWLGEYRRSQRASVWLRGLEAEVNGQLGHAALKWESRDTYGATRGGGHMRYPYVATAVLLLGTAYIAVLIGAYLAQKPLADLLGTDDWLLTVLPVVVYGLITEAVFLRFFRSKWREGQTDLERPT